MHLALSIGGMTVEEMEARMSEREFRLWETYAGEFFLPHRRADLQAAQIAFWLSLQYQGKGARVNLNDFVVTPAKPEEDKPNAEFGGAVFGAMASRKVIKLGQGRKAKAESNGK